MHVTQRIPRALLVISVLLGKNEAIPRMGFLRPNLDLIWLFIFSQDSPSPLLPTDSAEGGGWKASAGFGRWVVQDLPRAQHLAEIFVSSAHPNCGLVLCVWLRSNSVLCTYCFNI